MSNAPTDDARRSAPLFYCYQCDIEMHPLMVPDPHCSQCNGTFVEEVPSGAVDPTNEHDPRNFHADPFDGDDHFHPGDGGPFGPFGGPGAGDPIIHIMNMLMGGMPPPGGSPNTSRQGTTIRLDMNGGRGRVLFTSGGGASPPPFSARMGSPFGGVPSETGTGRLPPLHPLEGLLAMLAGRGGPPGAPGGQFGDYVLDQHSLDEIITRLMEQSQGSKPVPAPDDMIDKLPRIKVTTDSPLVEKECAVCKDTFEPSTTESVVTLPCSDNPKYQHTFHEDCIVPWLKQNGTCPVCRFQLVPQPEHHSPPPTSPGAGSGPSNTRNGPNPPAEGPSSRGSSSASAGPFGSFWDMFTAGRGSHSNNPSQRRPPSPQSGGNNPSSSGRGGRNSPSGSRNVPGGWEE